MIASRRRLPACANALIPIALLTLLASCRSEAPATTTPEAGTPDAGTTTNAKPTPGADTLVIASLSDIESFISIVQQSVVDQQIGDNMFLSLNSKEFDCQVLSPPGLAESFERTPDGLQLTYHLRKDLLWSDGTPITAKDVAFTFDLIADPAVASPRISYVEHMLPDARPRVLDDHTIRFEFTHAYDRLTQESHTGAVNILPEHALSKYDRASLRGTEFDKAPIVSGPFKLARHDKGSTIVLEPNPNYHGPSPATLKRVIFKVIPEYATRLIELESGFVDMVDNLQNVEDIARLKRERPEIKLYRRGWRFLDYIAWNLKNPLFKDAEVRRALTTAIDRDKIVKDLLTTADGDVLGKVAVSWLTPELCKYRTDELKPLPFSATTSKEMLAAAGWTDTNGDGIIDKDGQPFRFTLLTNSGNARRAKATVIIQSNLKDVGIDCQLQQLETNTFFERSRKRDYEAILSGWSAGLFVDPIELWHSDRPNQPYEFNFTGYSNPVADELMERGMRISDPDESAPIWLELQKLIHDDQPYTYLYWRDEVVPLHGRFRDARVDIMSYIHDINKWWVAETDVKYKQ